MGEFRKKNEWQILNSYTQLLTILIQLGIKINVKKCYKEF